MTTTSAISKAATQLLTQATRPTAQAVSKFAQAQRLAQRLNPSAEQFVLNKPMQPLFKRLMGPELETAAVKLTPQQKITQALETIAEHPVISPLYQHYRPQIEAAKAYLFRNWHRIMAPIRQIGEACGFVTTRQMGYTVKPVRDLYRNQITTLREGIRFDVYSGIFGGLLGTAKIGTALLGYELPMLIAIPTISAGMSMVASSVVGIVRKQRDLGRAQSALQHLMKFNRA